MSSPATISAGFTRSSRSSRSPASTISPRARGSSCFRRSRRCSAAGMVTRVTGSRWLGLGVGLALVALPGSQFKNYIQLAQAANTACLIAPRFRRSRMRAPVAGHRRARRRGARADLSRARGARVLLHGDLGGRAAALAVRPPAALGRRLLGASPASSASPAAWSSRRHPCISHLRSQNLDAAISGTNTPAGLSFLQASLLYDVLEVKKPEMPEVWHKMAADRQAREAAAAAAATPDTRAEPAPAPPAPASTPVVYPPRTHRGGKQPGPHRRRRKPLCENVHGPGAKRLLPFLTYAPFVGFGVFSSSVSAVSSAQRGARRISARPPAMLWLLLAAPRSPPSRSFSSSGPIVRISRSS